MAKFIKYTYRDGSKSKGTTLFGINEQNKQAASVISAQLSKQGYKVSIEERAEYDIIVINGKTAPVARPRIVHSSPCGDGCGISYGR